MRNMATAADKKPAIETREGTFKISSTTLEIKTSGRVELKTITEEIKAFVEQCSVRYGMLHVSCLHTTAGLILNEVQDALLSDLATMFEQVIPRSIYYKHNDPLHSDCDRKNADAHLRAVVVGHSVNIPIEDGELKLGTWQNIVFTEFDGPNTRKLHVQVTGI